MFFVFVFSCELPVIFCVDKAMSVCSVFHVVFRFKINFLTVTFLKVLKITF